MLGKDVANEVFESFITDLGLPLDKFTETDKDEETKNRLVSSVMAGRLEYSDGDFTLKLITPVKTGEKTIEILRISEPTGVQLRSMSIIKKSNDDVGKAMAILGDVSGLGIEVINKVKSRDMMVAVEVIGLFL